MRTIQSPKALRRRAAESNWWPKHWARRSSTYSSRSSQSNRTGWICSQIRAAIGWPPACLFFSRMIHRFKKVRILCGRATYIRQKWLKRCRIRRRILCLIRLAISLWPASSWEARYCRNLRRSGILISSLLRLIGSVCLQMVVRCVPPCICLQTKI